MCLQNKWGVCKIDELDVAELKQKITKEYD
jgi:hypothetical protein